MTSLLEALVSTDPTFVFVMKFCSLLLAFGWPFLTADAIRSSHIVHERRDLHGDPWTQLGKADKELSIRARIALVQRNVESGHDWLMEV